MKIIKSKKILIPLICTIVVLTILASALFIISAQESDGADTSSGELEIFFFPLNPKGGDYNGDSCIIKIGDTEILVDGGDSRNSTDEIIKKMKSLISSDNKWDYIIVTHPDEDHIGGFSKDNGIYSLFNQTEIEKKNETKWTLGTFIDFDVSNDKTVKLLYDETDVKSTITKTNETYTTGRENLKKYSGAKYYTSSQCCWEARGLNKPSVSGADDEFDLGNGAKLHILYNYFYDHRHSESASVSGIDRNNLSVCFLIEYGEHSFLFTGDLMEYNSASNYSSVKGETKLIENNKELFERVMAQGNENVTFYKAAHHGSITSSSEAFIDYIRPEYVVIPVIAGTIQHTQTEDHIFPATQVCERLFKYTDKIYMPEYLEVTKDENGTVTKKEPLPYFGDIHIISNGEDVNVTTSKNQNKPVQKTDWYKQNRPYSLYVHTFALPSGTNGAADCTLIKYGSIDILIDGGIYSQDPIEVNEVSLVDSVKKYCVDGIIEYLIVTHAQIDSISTLIGQYKSNQPLNNGILGSFEILNLYDFTSSDYDYKNPQAGGYANTKIESNEGGWLYAYYEQRDKLNLVSHNENIGQKIAIDNKFFLTILNSEQKERTGENNYSLVTLIEFYDKKLLFMGDLTDDEDDEKELIKNNKALLSNITYFQPGYSGYKYSSTEDFLKVVVPEYTVLTSPLSFNIGGDVLPNRSTLARLIAYAKKTSDKKEGVKKIYALTENNNIPICGDITFSIIIKNEEVQRTSLVGSKSTVIITETDWYKNNK